MCLVAKSPPSPARFFSHCQVLCGLVSRAYSVARMLVVFTVACSPLTRHRSLDDAVAQRDERELSFLMNYPAFARALGRVPGQHSAHFDYSLAVASYHIMLSRQLMLSADNITRTVDYILRARAIAGPRPLFGNGTRIINILHEYDSFEHLFSATAIIKRERWLGAQPADIWTFQGPGEIRAALRLIARSKGPTTIYIYAHGVGQSIRLSDSESLELSALAGALAERGPNWTNILSDECDGVITYLPEQLRRFDAEIPSYIISSTPRGGISRGSRLLNAIVATTDATNHYTIDPRQLQFEDWAKSQDFVLIWTPTPTQRRLLERAWPFSGIHINEQVADTYPAGVWELARSAEENKRTLGFA
jgi:hypothetical protein